MRKLVTNTFVTLDGVMQAPGGPGEDPTGGFAFGGWSVNYWDTAMGTVMDAFVAKPFDLLLGRKTYEIFASHWPYVKNDPMADALNNAKKYVVSRTLKTAGWNNSFPVTGDVVGKINTLKKQQGPELQVHGSSNLIQTLLTHALIDEFHVWTFPVVIGKGKRLFDDGTVPAGLKLTGSETSTTGVIMSVYIPDGTLITGSFAPATPTDAERARRKKPAHAT